MNGRYDCLLRGATVIDGTGRGRFAADVAIAGDTIAAVGDLSAASAVQEISAEGLVVAPGFIDIHTHSDTTLFDYPEAESRTRQGITTEVVGNCSYSPFPVTAEVRAFMAPRLAEGHTAEAWRWDDLEGYRHCLEERGTAVNVVPLLGHGALRIAVMGPQNRAPTASELRRMQSLAGEVMDQGAFGLTSGLTLAPSSYCETEELVEISKPVAARGGFYATHSRLWSGYHFRAVEEAIRIGREAELPVQISHQTIIDPRHFGRAGEIVALMEQARAEGVDVRYDVYPYTAGGSGLDQFLPDWSLDGGDEAMLGRLANAKLRERIRDEVGLGWFRGIPWQWDRVVLAHVGQEDDQVRAGRSIAEVAELLGREPVDCMLDLIETQRNEVRIVMFNRDENDVRYFLSHPLSMIGSDGSSISPQGLALKSKPHPRFYGTYPRILGHYCRELGTMTLEQAIHKMTAAPAERLGLADRGTIAPGKKADLVVFDPLTVADRATFAEPHQFPTGIEFVLVNGRPVVTPEGSTGNLPGRVLAFSTK